MNAVNALAEALSEQPDVALAVLFGSEASDTAQPDSDLDVGVAGPFACDRLSSLEVELSRRAGRQVDLVSLDTAPPLLRFEVARTGRVLVERAPHLWPDFKARAMVDWWDWAPYAPRFAAAAAARLREGSTHGAA